MRLLVPILLAALLAVGCWRSSTAPETKSLHGNRIPPGAGPLATRH